MSKMTKTAAKESGSEVAASGVRANIWHALYRLADQVQAQEPWAWMNEGNVFAIQRAGESEPVFVSVMGQGGDYRAVALYPGVKAVDLFWRAHQTNDDELMYDLVLGTYQIHLEFGGRSEVDAREKRLLKELGLKFRNTWPLPRSRRPGHTEWFLDEDEARLLITALEQLLDVAPRFREDHDLLLSPAQNHEYLVRTPLDGDTASPWRDERRIFAPLPRTRAVFEPGPGISRLKRLPVAQTEFELDVFPSGVVIGKKGERGLRGFLFMVADSRSEMILTADALTPSPTWDDLWDGVPQRLLSLFDTTGARPAALAVKSHRLLTMLGPVCEALGIGLRRSKTLRALEKARRSMERFAGF